MSIAGLTLLGSSVARMLHPCGPDVKYLAYPSCSTFSLFISRSVFIVRAVSSEPFPDLSVDFPLYTQANHHSQLHKNKEKKKNVWGSSPTERCHGTPSVRVYDGFGARCPWNPNLGSIKGPQELSSGRSAYRRGECFVLCGSSYLSIR